MEVDTGATLSLISQEKCQELFPQLPLQKLKEALTTYTGGRIGVKGEIDVNIDIGFQSRSLTLLVVAGSGPTLLGRNWMHYTQVDWSGLGVAAVHHCDTNADTLEATLAKHSSVFSDELGLIHPFKAMLQVRPAAQPKFHRP